MTETGYAAGEALIETLVKTVTGFSTAGNVTRGKWGVLNTGKAAKYAILKPGPSGARVFEGHNQVQEPWSTIVQVWHRYRDDGTTLTDLEADVEAIITKIDKYPRMQDSTGYVLDSNISALSEVQEMWKKGGGPAWLRQDVTIEWVGVRVVTYA